MMEKIKYKCSCCGEEHEEWPALAYNCPVYYEELTAEEKENIATLTDDFCTIARPDHVDRFIRCTLTQKVIGHCENLDYGLWVSLSEKSYKDYSNNYDNEGYEAQYFGWLSNQLPDYDFTESIPSTVFTRKNHQRPEIVPHENFNHPFIKDYYNGITKEEAERRINKMLENISG